MNMHLEATKNTDCRAEKRPWGLIRPFMLNERQSSVNVLTVEPGKRLSLQSHEKREEIWIVLDDVAVIQVDDTIGEYRRGETIRIPAGSQHRLSNSGDWDIRILEITFGKYDPDDIIRFEDDYGREIGRQNQSTSACVNPK